MIKKRILSMLVLLLTAAMSAVAQLYAPPGSGGDEKTITLSPNNLTLTVGEEATVSYSLSGMGTCIPSWRITEGGSYISFKSLGSGNSKTVIANAPGTATIECYHEGWTSGYCTVTVTAPATYTVTLKEGTEDAGNWSFTPTEATTTGVVAGTTVTATYDGDLKVKSVMAKKTTVSTANITVFFTDAKKYGDVNVYYWPNGGDWPGTPMTSIGTNEYSQTVYKAEIPADVHGIIFNGNGRQTVNIEENIADCSWWYTNEDTDGQGHNTVGYVGTYFIGLTSTDGSNWTFQTPDYDVELEVEYYPLATLTTTPAATTGDIFENTTTALITAGASEEGTVYYAVSTSDATAPTDGWSTDVPTAEGRSADTYYIWYKVVGDDTHSNSVPQYIAVTIAAIPTYAVTIDDGSVDAANWEADPTEQQAGEKVKLTYKGKKKIKSITIEAAPILVTSITLNKTSTTISTGETETLSVTAVAPDNATDKTYTWKSSDETKATVDQNGVVTAKAAGTVTIYAEANDGSGVKGECAVTVQAVLRSETITFSGGSGSWTYSGTNFQATGEAKESGILHVSLYDTMVISARTGKTIVMVVFSYEWGQFKDTLSASPGTFDGNATVSNVNATSLTVSSSHLAGVNLSGVTVYYYE